MKCPKCGYTSFDYLRECKKCGETLDDCRQSLNLKMVEPTLFVDLEDEPSESIATENKPTPEVSESIFSDPDFLPPPTPPTNQSTAIDPSKLTTASVLMTSGELPAAPPIETASAGLGSLGSMDNIQPRPNKQIDSEILPKLDLGTTTDGVEGLELSPSFNPDNHTAPVEDNKKDEFSLFEDESNEQTDLNELIDNDIPFEFSASDLESDINLKTPPDNSDNDLIELELDMEDEESLDQILADFETDKK